jgi:hypothetical protein
MFRKLMMISAAVLGMSFATTATTPPTMKTRACDSGSQSHMMSYGNGRCWWCYCPGYVLRGNGFCGRCGHHFHVHGNIPALR